MLAPGYALGGGHHAACTVRVLRWTHPAEDERLADAAAPLLGVRPRDDAPGLGLAGAAL
ncbi:hypothetical protein ACIOGZ_29135 [Kitasatospora sp. NPDC088160]|uniref:hypothetical protein n=1 Tax=Kitasatospora sp. NPDC088160 TaxID=3364072 RepID=UPI0037FEEE7E